MAYGWPVDPNTNVSQNFGDDPQPAYQPDGHTGIDFALPVGSPVYAIGDGVVLHADWSKKLGWPNPYYISPDFTPNDGIDQSAGIVVVIDHGDCVSISAHLNSTGLNTGDRVTRGQTIGESGNTGFSSGPHLHFEILPDKWNVHAAFYGRVNPLNYISKTSVAPAASIANDQRITNAAVNYRSAPNTSADIIQKFEADTILDFKGYVTNGEAVESNSVWFVGKYTNGYAWSGGFTNSSTAGLANLTPAAPPTKQVPAPSIASDQRVTVATANYRKAPNTSADIIQEFPADSILDFKGYVTNGERVQDNSVWFVGKYSGGYVWSGNLVNKSTEGLANLTPTTPVTPPKPPVYTPPVVATPAYTFKADLACVTEVIPAGEGNFEYGNFPGKDSTGAVIHDYGTHGQDTYESAVAHFKQGNRDKPSSAHILVSWDHITQMVSFKDRAYGSGPDGNGFFQIEVDPEVFYGTEKGEKVKANLRLVIKELYAYCGHKLTLMEHNQIMPTQCGDEIDLAWVADIDYPEKPVPAVPTTVPSTNIKEEIAKHFEALAVLFKKL